MFTEYDFNVFYYLYAILSVQFALVSCVREEDFSPLLYFRNHLKPLAFYLLLIFLPDFYSVLTKGSLEPLLHPSINFFKHLMGVLTLFYYLLLLVNDEEKIPKIIYKIYYTLLVTGLLVMTPVTSGYKNPYTLAICFSVSYSVTSLFNVFFIGHHIKTIFLHRDFDFVDCLFDIFFFRSEYSVNNPRGYHIYRESVLPALFVLSITIIGAQTFMANYTSIEDDSQNRNLSWNEFIVISNSHSLTELSSLTSNSPNRTPSSDFADYKRIAAATPEPNSSKNKPNQTEAVGEKKMEELFSQMQADSINNSKNIIKALLESKNVDSALIAELVKSRLINKHETRAPANSDTIGKDIIGIYFFKNILAMVLVCLTIALIQMRTLRGDYINKWNKLNDRLYIIIPNKDPLLWRQLAIDMIDMKMWGHASFQPHFEKILRSSLKIEINKIHNTSEIKNEL